MSRSRIGLHSGVEGYNARNFSVKNVVELCNEGLNTKLIKVPRGHEGPYEISWKQKDLGYVQNQLYLGLRGGKVNFYVYFFARENDGSKKRYPVFVAEEALENRDPDSMIAAIDLGKIINGRVTNFTSEVARGDESKSISNEDIDYISSEDSTSNLLGNTQQSDTKMAISDAISSGEDIDLNLLRKTEHKYTPMPIDNGDAELKAFLDHGATDEFGPCFLSFGIAPVDDGFSPFFVIMPSKYAPFQSRFFPKVQYVLEKAFTKEEEAEWFSEAKTAVTAAASQAASAGKEALGGQVAEVAVGQMAALGVAFATGGASLGTAIFSAAASNWYDRSVGYNLRFIGDGNICTKANITYTSTEQDDGDEAEKARYYDRLTSDNLRFLALRGFHYNIKKIAFGMEGNVLTATKKKGKKKGVYIAYYAAENTLKSKVYPVFVHADIFGRTRTIDISAFLSFLPDTLLTGTCMDRFGSAIIPLTGTVGDKALSISFGYAGTDGYKHNRLFFVIRLVTEKDGVTYKDAKMTKQADYIDAYKEAMNDIATGKVMIPNNSWYFGGTGDGSSTIPFRLHALVAEFHKGKKYTLTKFEKALKQLAPDIISTQYLMLRHMAYNTRDSKFDPSERKTAQGESRWTRFTEGKNKQLRNLIRFEGNNVNTAQSMGIDLGSRPSRRHNVGNDLVGTRPKKKSIFSDDSLASDDDDSDDLETDDDDDDDEPFDDRLEVLANRIDALEDKVMQMGKKIEHDFRELRRRFLKHQNDFRRRRRNEYDPEERKEIIRALRYLERKLLY